MKSEVYVGIDVSSRKLVVSFVDDKGKDIRPTSTFKNSPGGWQKLSNIISTLKQSHRVVCGLEATGDHHIGILNVLNSIEGIEVHELNPASVKAFARVLNMSAKTDRLDSRVIALYLLRIQPEKSYTPPHYVRRMRNLARMRRSLVEYRASLKNQLHHILRVYFPGYRALVKHSFPVGLLHILNRYPSPHLIIMAGKRRLMRLKIGPSHYPRERIVDGIIEVSMRAPERELLEGEQGIIRWLTGAILEINGLIRGIEKDMWDMVEKYYPEQKLTTIPGIGKVTAGVILAEVGDVRRFMSKRKFIGYCGLYPMVYESGEMRMEGRMTYKGNRMLKMTLLLAGVSARRSNIQVRAYYERLMRRGKSKRAAGGAVARKLAEIVYAILVSGEEWSREKALEGIKKGEEMARAAWPMPQSGKIDGVETPDTVVSSGSGGPIESIS